MFGALQTGAAERASTGDIWSSLRQTAGSWLYAAQGQPAPSDDRVLEEVGRQVLSTQGVDAASVSAFRGIAGSWLGAKQALHALDLGQQVTAGEIFRPPWSATANALTPSRYRIRTQWQYESAAGDILTGWKSDELTAPLTTKGDALTQALPTPNTQSGAAILSGGSEPILLDYEIEQI